MKSRIPLIIILISSIVFACGKKEETVPETVNREPMKITVARAEKSDIPQFSESVGTVKAVRMATVSSKIMGTIVRLSFKEGDRVKEGAVLVEIDGREIKAQMEQALGALSEATAAFNNAEINLGRMKSLLDKKSATTEQVDNSTMQYNMAKARTRQAQANVEALKVMQGYADVSAPFDGVITGKDVEKGEMASAGMPLFTITDDRLLRLETEISESEIKGVKAGGVMDVRVDAVDEVLKGKVSLIVPSGDPATHSFLVKIDLPPTEGLLPGMFGSAYITKGTTVSLLVPKSALTVKGQLTAVFVVKDKTAGYRMIKTGWVGNDRVEILSGLTEGEEVAVNNIEKLTDGSPIEVIK